MSTDKPATSMPVGIELFFHRDHPNNSRVFTDMVTADNILRAILGENEHLQRFKDDEVMRKSLFNTFFRMIIFDESMAGVRSILNDLIGPHLPDRNIRCIFGGKSPRDEVRKWPAFMNEALNAFVADGNSFSYEAAVDHAYASSCPNLTKWIIGCLDAHYIATID